MTLCNGAYCVEVKIYFFGKDVYPASDSSENVLRINRNGRCSYYIDSGGPPRRHRRDGSFYKIAAEDKLDETTKKECQL